MTRQVLNSAEMIPAVWQAAAGTQIVRVFNPAILAVNGQWVLAYRVDYAPDGHHIAICRLDDKLRTQPTTVIPLSDQILNGGTLPQDPRLICYRERLWLYYDHYRPGQPNQMVIVELDPDTLQPIGPARQLLLNGVRQRTEKSWMLFVFEDELYAVYRMTPHIILRLDLTPADHVVCQPVHNVTWDDQGYSQRYGELRGGTPPVRVGDCYYAFFHSWYSSSRMNRLIRPSALAIYHRLQQWRARPRPTIPDHAANIAQPARSQPTRPQPGVAYARLLDRYRRRFEQRWYVVGFYAFAAQPPFAPVCFTPTPILEPQQTDRRLFAQSLNPYANRSVFPTGAVLQADNQWLVSYGLDTEQAALCTFSHDTLRQGMVQLAEGREIYD